MSIYWKRPLSKKCFSFAQPWWKGKGDFVTYTSKGVHVVQIYFDQEFWTNISAKATLFYIERIIPYMCVELMK